MRVPQSGIRIDMPSYPVLQDKEAYRGVTSAAGNALGTTLVCADLDNHPTYANGVSRVKVLTNGAWGQDRLITSHAAGGILTVDQPFTDATGAIQQIGANTIFVILTSSGGGMPTTVSLLPKASLLETWQLEVFDPAIWDTTDPATGTAWTIDAVWTPYLRAMSAPNANETSRIRSVQRWIAGAGAWGNNTYQSKLHLLFEMRLANVANLDNTLCLFGLTAGGVATRATDNIICFALLADVLATLSDAGGVETQNTGFGETLTDWNLFHIAISAGKVDFFLNRGIIASHVANIPDLPMFLNFYLDTEAGGAGTIGLGQIAVLMEVG